MQGRHILTSARFGYYIIELLRSRYRVLVIWYITWCQPRRHGRALGGRARPLSDMCPPIHDIQWFNDDSWYSWSFYYNWNNCIKTTKNNSCVQCWSYIHLFCLTFWEIRLVLIKLSSTRPVKDMLNFSLQHECILSNAVIWLYAYFKNPTMSREKITFSESDRQTIPVKMTDLLCISSIYWSV